MTWKSLAIVLLIVSLAAISETQRIFTSNAPDIVENRGSLKVMSVIFTTLILAAAVLSWRKGMKK
jgi:hypothetical protein